MNTIVILGLIIVSSIVAQNAYAQPVYTDNFPIDPTIIPKSDNIYIYINTTTPNWEYIYGAIWTWKILLLQAESNYNIEIYTNSSISVPINDYIVFVQPKEYKYLVEFDSDTIMVTKRLYTDCNVDLFKLTDRAIIVSRNDLSPKDAYFAGLHEFGHVLGLRHVSGTLMDEILQYQLPQLKDIEHVEGLRSLRLLCY